MDPMTTTYDDLPYDSGAFWPVHPDRLAVTACLHDVRTAPVERCRVLELGCGCGENIIPMAAYLPQSQFTGIDLSSRQIDQARATAGELGLANLRLTRQDILDFDGEGGPFDYILCHGVYSWVPPPVRARILDICRRHLAERGVAMISHNVYPGWHLNMIVRDVLEFGAAGANAAAQRLRQGMGFLDFLCRHLPQADTPYGARIREAADYLRQQADHYVYHEFLEEVNSPGYFLDFAAAAGQTDLQYVGDALLQDVRPYLSGDAMRTIEAQFGDPLKQEQVLDFLSGRAFRHSLLCRKSVPVRWPVRHEAIAHLWLRATCRPESAGPDQAGPPARATPPRGEGLPSLRSTSRFLTGKGQRATIEDPFLQAALEALCAALPAAVACADLLAAVAAQQARASQRSSNAPNGSSTQAGQDRNSCTQAGRADGFGRELSRNGSHTEALLAAAATGLVHLHSWAPPLAWPAPPRPAAWPLVRWQARRSSRVVTPWHQTVQLDPIAQSLVPFLDGRTDRAQLGEQLLRLANEKKLALADGQDLELSTQNVPSIVDAFLEGLARACLLGPG